MSVRLWVVQVLALGAVELDRGEARLVVQANGEKRMQLTVEARAIAEIAVAVLFKHLVQPPGGQDEPRVYETISGSGVELEDVAVLLRLQLYVYVVCYYVDQSWQLADLLV